MSPQKVNKPVAAAERMRLPPPPPTEIDCLVEKDFLSPRAEARSTLRSRTPLIASSATRSALSKVKLAARGPRERSRLGGRTRAPTSLARYT